MGNGYLGPLSPAGLGGAIGSRTPQQAIASSLSDAVAAARNRNEQAGNAALQAVTAQLGEVADGIKKGTLKADGVVPELTKQFEKDLPRVALWNAELADALQSAFDTLKQPAAGSGSGPSRSADKGWNAQNTQVIAQKRLGAQEALNRLDRDDPNDPLVHRFRSSGMTAEQQQQVRDVQKPAVTLPPGDVNSVVTMGNHFKMAEWNAAKTTGELSRQFADIAAKAPTLSAAEAKTAMVALRDNDIAGLVLDQLKDTELSKRFGAALQALGARAFAPTTTP